MHDYVLFFKLSSRKGRNKAGEQNGIPCVFTLLSEERKNLREQPCLCLHCSLPSPQSPIFMVRKISPAFEKMKQVQELLSQFSLDNNLLVSVRLFSDYINQPP